jgi:hypothetical protein
MTICCLWLQVLDTTCIVSAVLIDGAKQKAEEVAKQAADTALKARRGSSGGAASSNGSSEPAAASGKKPSGAKVSRVLGTVMHSSVQLHYLATTGCPEYYVCTL